ncbi:mRNA-degrading endonuclease RelE of RelBE toxin-antitoxin system [Saccharopolyspora lacisalsi]|uniref:mRNA-degrading endonuclease RelE of RelBE toxin-antitoxin system n=1 Tax=Halosaccharopolyspora lacisalsi TaxID=1000566 RepID=A0A839E510_9PSEU|nr:type II toxin-antitoxin system RelE/ParE family toxin [Halosaccharopolyspora lacisalsi]MBA8826925.1 mRNA-degrading endonuclease RelE of RelBE toxin-antitoxin system [Halosaccharopolyspora lacisalsi]
MNDRYAVEVGRAARRALAEKLPIPVAAAVLEFIEGPLAENPHRVGAPLKEPFVGQWRAGRGDYRVRYRVDEQHRVVFVTSVDHRRDAYRLTRLSRAG